MGNEEYVRSVWERVSCVNTPLSGWVVCAVLNGNVCTALPLTESLCATEAAAWAAAAEFTRDQLEEIRKVKLSSLVMNHWGAIGKDYPGQIAAWTYITTLLNAELARLTAGMKQEAL